MMFMSLIERDDGSMKLKIKIDERIKKRQQKIAQRNIDKAIDKANERNAKFSLPDLLLVVFIDIPLAVIDAIISGMT